VGYGLDYNQQGRNLPDVYSVIRWFGDLVSRWVEFGHWPPTFD
jgi:hypothetical protein